MVNILLFIKNELGICYQKDNLFVHIIILILKQAYKKKKLINLKTLIVVDQNQLENIVV